MEELETGWAIRNLEIRLLLALVVVDSENLLVKVSFEILSFLAQILPFIVQLVPKKVYPILIFATITIDLINT